MEKFKWGGERSIEQLHDGSHCSMICLENDVYNTNSYFTRPPKIIQLHCRLWAVITESALWVSANMLCEILQNLYMILGIITACFRLKIWDVTFIVFYRETQTNSEAWHIFLLPLFNLWQFMYLYIRYIKILPGSAVMKWCNENRTPPPQNFNGFFFNRSSLIHASATFKVIFW